MKTDFDEFPWWFHGVIFSVLFLISTCLASSCSRIYSSQCAGGLVVFVGPLLIGSKMKQLSESYMEGCIVSGMLSAGLLFSITPEFNFFKIRTGAIITLSIIGFLVSSIVELLAFWVYSDDLMKGLKMTGCAHLCAISFFRFSFEPFMDPNLLGTSIPFSEYRFLFISVWFLVTIVSVAALFSSELYVAYTIYSMAIALFCIDLYVIIDKKGYDWETEVPTTRSHGIGKKLKKADRKKLKTL